MTPRPISATYFKNPSHQSMSECASRFSLLDKGFSRLLARQLLGKQVPAEMNTHETVKKNCCFYATEM